MSRTYGVNATLMFDTQHTHPVHLPVDFSKTNHYQLEYLDLSSTDTSHECGSGFERPRQNAFLHTEAEFYSFDDYLPASTIIDLDYEDVTASNNNNRLKSENFYPARSSCTKFDYIPESHRNCVGDLTWKLDNGVKDASRTNSTCSGSSTSSQPYSPLSRPFSLSAARYEVGPIGSFSSQPTMANKRKLPLKLSHSTSVSLPHSLYDMDPNIRPSLSSDSFKYRIPQSDIEASNKTIAGSALPNEYSKVTSDNHQLHNNRTEELLNGIVKLAEDTVLESLPAPTQTRPAHPIQVQNKHKAILRTSKSSPHLSSLQSQSQALNPTKAGNVKSSSPLNTSKRFAISRKSSFTFHHSADYDKKLDRKNKANEKAANATAHVNAFLDAVEHFDIDKVAHLISVDNSCVNSVNNEGLTALDIAVLTNHVPMIKTLTKYGAETRLLELQTDNNLCATFQNWISGAEQQLNKLKLFNSSSGASQKENEKKLNQWEFKHRLFRRMKTGYEQAGLPGQPQNVKLGVTSDSSLLVQFDSPEGTNGAVVTRYKVEWSKAQNFRPLTGEVIINDMNDLQFNITGLDSGSAYYVRVTAWNIKGFGRCSHSSPLYAIPSSWRDVENFESRTNSFKLHKINEIIENIRRQRNQDNNLARTSSNNSQPTAESPPNHRKASAPLMRGLRGLFSSSFKFQKCLKRGVYLACICYNDDKILVTTEENLPIIEVDESYSGNSLQADFDWLMRVVTSSWDTARQLKQDFEKLSELGSVHLKNQLLTAILQLQEMMGMQDLGRLFYKPINDGNGSIVFAIINQITDPKQVSNIASSLKWQSQNKLARNSQASDPLLPFLNEMIFFHQVYANKLPDGLYLGYLHTKFNTESLRVLAPENNPSVLPYMKIRNCPNISKPEWKSLLDLALTTKSTNRNEDTNDIITFKKQLLKSARKLADKLGLSSEQLGDHRIYDVEVLDFSKNVSFILLMPPRDLVCSMKTQSSSSEPAGVMDSSDEYMEIPMKAFEMIHLNTYQSDFISAFSKAVCLVDTQLVLAQHTQREAFSNEEIESSRKQVESARTYQQQLEEIWRSTRWLVDAIAYARDRERTPGVSLTQLFTSVFEPTTTDNFGKSSDDGYHSDKISLGGSTGSDKLKLLPNNNQNNTNNNNGQYYDGESDYHHQPSIPTESSEQLKPGILRVFAAYNSGLAKGTSVMLHVTPRTTSREVVDLVVMQLNNEIRRKGLPGPVYMEEELLDFCLVAVIGPRERVLRDDYKLLQLQNPWIKGKLYVRLKNNLLAALEHGETTVV